MSEEELLLERLRSGAGADEPKLRRELDLSPDCDDRDLARELVARIASANIQRCRVDREHEKDTRDDEGPTLMSGADSSFLGRLSVTADERSKGPSVEDLEDVQTLIAVLRAGTLAQRRAATIRLGGLLAEGELSNVETRAASTVLLNVRDVEIAFEAGRAREALPGAKGREARQENETFTPIVEKLVPDIEDFWSGQSNDEPIAAMPAEALAQLMVRLRDAPDIVAAHIGSVLDGSDGVTDRDARRATLSSVRHSGDRRLVPTLVAMLESRAADLGSEAARALARIDDPRVLPALARAYERSVGLEERAILAGALGLVGDVRGRESVRQLLESDDERVLLEAVRAMESLAMAEDTERLSPLLQRTDPVLLTHVIRALGNTGEPLALPPLVELRGDAGLSALYGEAEDAETRVRATLDLRGEEVPEMTESFAISKAAATGVAERSRDPIVVRVVGYWDFLIAHLWLFFGLGRRAVARFERAASRRPGWSTPLAALALHHARRDRPAAALAAFRRALEADRGAVESNLYAIRVLAQIFLRRADEVERGGRVDVARGLIDEVLSLDLRRVPGALRFELSRRQEQLRLRGAS